MIELIRLQRHQKPVFLSPANALELTETFTKTGASVWNHPEIKISLMESSHAKCAFCECSLSSESNYMEVEHFKCKDLYKDLVVDWVNLLPACKRCNIAKGTHDVGADPIIDPYEIDPRDHLFFRLYQLKGKDALGKSTVDVLDLNNSDRLVIKRFEVGQQTLISIEDACGRLEQFLSSRTTRRKNKLLSVVDVILDECQPNAVYAATTATVALNDEDFLRIISTLRDLSLWESYLEEKLVAAAGLAIPC